MRNPLVFFATSLFASLFLLLFISTTRALPNNIKIGEMYDHRPMLQNIPDTKDLCNINIFDLEGGLFEETNSVEEIAFKYAVDHINRFDFSSNVYN